MAKAQSQGTCNLCGYKAAKAGMTRHLTTCPNKHDVASGKTSKLFRLRVEAAHMSEFWLDIEIKGSASLRNLDQFLRDTWLECCGHLSMFRINNMHYDVAYEADEEASETEAQNRSFLEAMWRERGIPEDKWPPFVLEQGMDLKVAEIFKVGLGFTHEYDFGTTTELKLKVVSEREGNIGLAKLRLLSRNNDPERKCAKCGANAKVIHTEKMWEGEDPFFCKKHARGWDDYPYLPVVNSPRMGMCGYTG